MDYINYVKEYPLQGLTGLWGGTTGALVGGTAPEPDPGETEYYGGRAILTIEGEHINYWSIENSSTNASHFGECSQTHVDKNSCAASAEGRAVWAGGNSDPGEMMYLSTSSTGNGNDFGNMTMGRYAPVGSSNGLRMGIATGTAPGGAGNTDNIEYITVATTGNGTNFGDSLVSRHGRDTISGGARMIMANGQDPYTDTIDYISLSTTGNAKDFGDTTIARTFGSGGNTDPGSGQNRGLFICGIPFQQSGDYITCDTTSNATDWGELLQGYYYRMGCGTNGSRVFAAGGTGGGNEITYQNVDTINSCTAGGDITHSGDAMGTSGPS